MDTKTRWTDSKESKYKEYKNLKVGSFLIATFYQDAEGVTYVKVKDLAIGMQFTYEDLTYRFAGLRGYRIDDYGGSSLRGYATRIEDKSEWTFHRDTFIEIVPFTYASKGVVANE